MLEDELRHQLRAPRVVKLVRSDDLAECRRARVDNGLSSSGSDVQQRVIESIDEFHPQLDLHVFSQVDILAQP